jgi:hypothetical protein
MNLQQKEINHKIHRLAIYDNGYLKRYCLDDWLLNIISNMTQEYPEEFTEKQIEEVNKNYQEFLFYEEEQILLEI